METRASYAVVGSFVLVMVAALFAFLVFITKAQFDNVTQPYHIYFSGSVTGLQEGSAVRYHGVGVGAVRDIRIAPDDPSRVRVTIELENSSRLPSDSIATIEPQGITGLAYIQIIGGEKGSTLMDVRAGDIPVIPSRPSQIAEVVDAAPELLNRMIVLADRTSAFLTPENAKKMEVILSNLEALSGSANTTVTALGNAADKVAGLGGSLDKTSQEATKMMSENREALRDFANVGLYDAGLLIAELRELVGNMSRMSSQIQRDPTGFLLAGPRNGETPSTSRKSP